MNVINADFVMARNFNIYGPNKDDISVFKLLESTLLENDEKHT